MNDKFSLKVFRSVTEKKLTLGIPSNLLYLNATITFLFIFNFHNPWIIPFNIILHLLIYKATKRDPEFFDCLSRNIDKEKYYGI